MWKTDLRIELSRDEREDLERLSRSLTAAVRDVVRAKTILGIADGQSVSAVSQAVGIGRNVVRKWSVRFLKKRMKGLRDEPRSGRPPRFSPGAGHAPGEGRLRAA